MMPVVVGMTWMVTVALAPLAKLPRLQVTMLPVLVQGGPWLGVAETKVMFPGKLSVTMMSVAWA